MHRDTFDALQRFLSLGLLAGVTVLFVWVLQPFIMSVFWAVVLAILLYPLFLMLKRDLKQPSLAAAVSMVIGTLVICVPLYFVGALAVKEGVALYQNASVGGLDLSRLTTNPLVSQVLTFSGTDAATAEAWITEQLSRLGQIVGAQALSLSLATLSAILSIGVMLYLLFFFLRDGEKLTGYLQRIIPLGDVREKLLFTRFASTTRAVVKGTLIVSIVQGIIGAILFWIAGIHSPALWGAVMALVATIPAIGPFIVWLPAGVLLLAAGQIWQGLVVILGGMFIIGLVDNLLRPILVGRDTEMPDALVLLAILGGIATFGMAGIIIGPVIAALFLSIWDLFGKDFGEEFASRG